MAQTNSEVKKANGLHFFRVLRQEGMLSRKELEDLTGLSWGSISYISNEFLKKGMIVAKKEAVTTGRPPDVLAVNPHTHLSLGIDINSIGLSFNVVNLVGESLFSAFFLLENNTKEYLLSLLESEAGQLIRRYHPVGINIAMQGKVDRQRGISVRTGFFENWKNIHLTEFFEERFHIPTRLYHDPESLLAFHRYTDPRLRDADNGIVIRVDDGIGMAQMIGGDLYATKSDSSCELGHTISVPNGRPCACGKRGCLETYSALRGMKNALGISGNETFFNFLNARNADVMREMDEACDRLGVAVANLFTLYSPSFVLLDGIVPAMCPSFFDRVYAATTGYLGSDCNLMKAAYRRDAAAIGACLLSIDSCLEDYLFGESAGEEYIRGEANQDK